MDTTETAADLLDAELARRRVRKEAAEAKSRPLSGFVEPGSDPELFDLFQEFARRMPPESAIPFVHYEQRSGVDVVRSGFLKIREDRFPWTRWEHNEVERGWYIFGGARYSRGCDKTDVSTYLMHGFGITTEGEPRLVGWQYRDEYLTRGQPPAWVFVSGGPGPGDPVPDLQFGPVPGSNLRASLMSLLRLDARKFPGIKTHQNVMNTPFTYQVASVVSDPGQAVGRLPAYMAQEMGKLLHEAGCD